MKVTDETDVQNEPCFDPAKLDLAAYTGYLITQAHHILINDLSRTLEPFGLRKLTFSALKVVVQYPGISQSQLAAALSMERSNLVTLLDEMESGGFLTRNPVPTNRRAHALRPTKAGIELAQKASNAVEAREAQLFAKIAPEDLLAARRVLLTIPSL